MKVQTRDFGAVDVNKEDFIKFDGRIFGFEDYNDYILLYDDVCMHTKELTIPHIDMCNRMFVLEPLMQIAPGLVHPVRRRTIYDLYHILKEKENA